MDGSTILGKKKLLEANCSAAIPKSRTSDTETSNAPKVEKRKMTVTGYDTSLPKDLINSALIKHFSPCGEVILAIIPGGSLIRRSQTRGLDRIALVYILGEGAAEKAVKLNGRCKCDLEECKIVVDKVMPPDSNINRLPLNCGGLPASFTPPPKA